MNLFHITEATGCTPDGVAGSSALVPVTRPATRTSIGKASTANSRKT